MRENRKMSTSQLETQIQAGSLQGCSGAQAGAGSTLAPFAAQCELLG